MGHFNRWKQVAELMFCVFNSSDDKCRMMADLQEGAVPEPCTQFNYDVSAGTQFIDLTHKVVAFHVCSRLTILQPIHAAMTVRTVGQHSINQDVSLTTTSSH